MHPAICICFSVTMDLRGHYVNLLYELALKVAAMDGSRARQGRISCPYERLNAKAYYALIRKAGATHRPLTSSFLGLP